MKIAIVSFYLMESTIPLAKYLSLSGNQIDLYSLLPYGNQNTFVYNFLGNPQRNGFVDVRTARTAIGENLNNYLLGLKLKIFIYPDRWFQKLFLEDFMYAYKLAKYVKKGDYDTIHIIHFSKRFWLFFYLFLPKKKIIQTLHEVTSHEEKTSFLDASRLKWLIKNSTPIIFHSNISKMRFLEFRKTVTTKKIIENNLTMIRFGLFETYQFFSNHTTKPKPNGRINILNFGRIVPSKGIHFLIEAVKILQDQYPIDLIIAGNGTPYFEFDNVKNYEFINRFISNEEIVSLIELCDIVVLPYTSASQSGVPMTVYNFNKPIIASDIAGFKEVIDNFNTGILVEDTNALSLASAIEILLSNTELRNKMSNNIKNKYSEGEFSWAFIADKTLSFYQTHQVNN